MRILIVEENYIIGEAISTFLRDQDSAELVAAFSLSSAIELIRSQKPFDLIVLGLNLPDINGLDGLRVLLREPSACPIAILAGNLPLRFAKEAMALGAVGFLPRTLNMTSFVNAMKLMIAGEIYLPFEWMQQAATHPLSVLTERELAALSRICQGKSNKQIARELDLQQVTIKLHVRNMCSKIGAQNRTHAAMLARNSNIF
ncbi:MAG: response regulator transcription factor [Octadecabacter sp.]